MISVGKSADWKDAERIRCRRPISREEVPYLEALGARVRAIREAAGLTRRGLAEAAQMSEGTVQRIEVGIRRTRRSTLERIVAALVPGRERRKVVAELCALAGPALGEESPYRARIERRRDRRRRRYERTGRRVEALAVGQGQGELRRLLAKLERSPVYETDLRDLERAMELVPHAGLADMMRFLVVADAKRREAEEMG